MPKLFSYKMTHDTGFAPNPFWGVLTLATCKPGIRRNRAIGDWIAGFTSKELCGKKHGRKLCDHTVVVGEERLVYLMQIEEKIVFADYSNRFIPKIPNIYESQCIFKAGDNIYKPKCHNPSFLYDFELLNNPNHNESHKKRDLSGKYVVVANRFFYFGKNALFIPVNIRPEVPRGQSAYGVQTHDQNRAQNFINYIVNNWQIGIHGEPHSWPKGDSSWKE